MLRPPPWLRLALLAAVIAAIAAAAFHRELLQAPWLAEFIANHPGARPLAYVVVHVAASLAFVPRTVMAVAAGALFGAAWGTVWSTAGAMAGAVAGFAIARWINADLVRLEDMRGIGPLLERGERGGWRFVMATRLVPVLPHALINYVHGLSRVSFADYALGSFLGMLPQTLAFAQLGEAGAAAASGEVWLRSLAWAAALLALAFVLPRLLPQRWRR